MLRVLRPAESAMRRLIVIAARGLVVKVVPSRPMPKGLKIGKSGATQFLLPTLRYAERFPGAAPAPRKVRASNPPRIHFFGGVPRVVALWPVRPPVAVAVPPLPPDGLVNAERLFRRLNSLKFALDDLPRQARRLGPLADEAGGRESSKVQIAAPAGSSSRPPQKANSSNR